MTHIYILYIYLYICVSKLTITGSDDGLAPTNAGILLIRTIGVDFSEILSETQTFSLRKCIYKCQFGNFVSASMCKFAPGVAWSTIMILAMWKGHLLGKWLPITYSVYCQGMAYNAAGFILAQPMTNISPTWHFRYSGLSSSWLCHRVANG